MSKLKNVFLSMLVVLFLCQIIGVLSIGNVVLAEEIVYGDINGDQKVDSIDFALMRQHILGIIKEFDNANGIKAADVDGNRVFNSIDFAFMRKYLLGFIDVFPVYQVLTPTPTPSSKIEFEDVVISSDIVLKEDRFYMNLVLEEGATLDLNGHALNVKGDFLQYKGNVIINSGSLHIDNNYTIYEDGMLQMTNEADYVYVGGDFITYAGNNDFEVIDSNLTAGVMEVKGDFCCKREEGKIGRYVATRSHKVILSGDDEQVVYNDSSWLVFNELEITNEKGVKFDSLTPISLMKGNYKVLDEAILEIGEITGNVVIDGNLTIIDQEIDLAGHCFTINGNLKQYTAGRIYNGDIAQICKIKINGGSLKVKGDYIIGDDHIILECGYYSILEMTNEKDYVYVGGDFITYAGNNNFEIEDTNLTAGVMEVKGDFWCKREDRSLGRYVAKGSHKVILSGNEEQVVYNDSGWLVFNELEIKNETIVRFDSTTAIVRISNMSNDVTINGDLSIVNQEFDLNGHSLIVTGDFNQFSTYGPSLLKVNGGSLRVNGDYNVGYDNLNNQFESINDTGSVLQMTNESDYVYVGGNFSTASAVDHSDYLIAGTLEVKGNFTQSNNPLNFTASGTHKTILSGDTVQTITFESPTTSSFNILQLTKPLNAGYIFNTTPVWRNIEE